MGGLSFYIADVEKRKAAQRAWEERDQRKRIESYRLRVRRVQWASVTATEQEIEQLHLNLDPAWHAVVEAAERLGGLEEVKALMLDKIRGALT